MTAVSWPAGLYEEDPVPYYVTKATVGSVLHMVWRPTVTGEENVPRTGGAIIASNHVSIMDSLFLPLMVRRPVTFPAKIEYFTGTRLIDRATAAYLRRTRMLSVDRSGARAGQEMLDAALRLVQAGEIFGIYPEGTRSPDGRLYRGRTGVGWLALASGVPVIPVAMIGTDRVLPPGTTRPRLGRVEVRIGKPLTFEEHLGGETRGSKPAKARREVTDEVMHAIQALSGQEYAPVYASDRKAEVAAQAHG
jgi:1-acyl-sn-glycerol-3-phosphate acyltransferase